MQVQVSSCKGRETTALPSFLSEPSSYAPDACVTATALTSELPLSGEDATLDVYRGYVDRPADAPVQDVDGFRYAVTPVLPDDGYSVAPGRWSRPARRSGGTGAAGADQ